MSNFVSFWVNRNRKLAKLFTVSRRCYHPIETLHYASIYAWGQDGWKLTEFFFCVIMNREEVEVYKTQQKNDGQIFPAQIAN